MYCTCTLYNVHCTVLITKNRQMNTQENKTKTLFELFYVKCHLMYTYSKISFFKSMSIVINPNLCMFCTVCCLIYGVL